MRKPDFERCTLEATKLLHKQDVSKRILNIQNLAYDKTIVFDSIQNYSLLTNTPLSSFLAEDKQVLRDGCTLYKPAYNCYLVLYNNAIDCFEHLNWTLGHEIGHIYLGHTDDGDLEEVEAHYFASQLFMPEYSLFMTAHEFGSISSEDIIEIFGVSDTAAKKRIKTMNKRIYFDASTRSKEIWEVQRERVDIYFSCKKDGSDYRNTLEFWNQFKIDYVRDRRLESYS